MKLKQKIPLWAVRCVGWGAVFALTIGCKKEDPCGLALCCGAPVQKMSFIKNLENVGADIGLASEFIIEGLNDEYTKGQSTARLCYLQEQAGTFAGQLRTTYDFRTNTPQPYKYRVWGAIYNCDDCPTTFPSNVHYLKLTKIEYQN